MFMEVISGIVIIYTVFAFILGFSLPFMVIPLCITSLLLIKDKEFMRE